MKRVLALGIVLAALLVGCGGNAPEVHCFQFEGHEECIEGGPPERFFSPNVGGGEMEVR